MRDKFHLNFQAKQILYTQQLLSAFIVCLLSLTYLSFVFPCTAYANPGVSKEKQKHKSNKSPIEQIPNSKAYKKSLYKQEKNSKVKVLYSEKWFNAGSFYGQVFLHDYGHLRVYDWLNIPSKIYSPVTTEVDRDPEYIKTTRVYLDDKSKNITLTILIPHPRSIQSIEHGLVEEFLSFTPKESDILKQTEILIGNKKAQQYQLQSAECSVLIHAAKETLIDVRVESCNQEENLINFVKTFNLELFDQRLQS